MGELKPCPFCGGSPDTIRGDDIRSGKPKWYKVYCKRCQNRTWEHPRKKHAIEAWNTRATDPTHARAAGELEKIAGILADEQDCERIVEYLRRIAREICPRGEQSDD